MQLKYKKLNEQRKWKAKEKMPSHQPTNTHTHISEYQRKRKKNYLKRIENKTQP